MTKPEFNESMGLLIAAFGKAKWPDARIALVWKKVQDLDAKWFQRLVEEMVLKMDDRVNIGEQAASRKWSLRSQASTQTDEEKDSERTDGRKYFEKLGFKDFKDFMKNKNRGPA